MPRKVTNDLLVTPNHAIQIDGAELNPIPTTVTDVPTTSRTFTLSEPASLLVTYGCRMQMNVTMTATLRLNVNLVDVAPNIFVGKETSTGIIQESLCRTARVDLPAGVHTIKLTAAASIVSASAVISPFWSARIVEFI